MDEAFEDEIRELLATGNKIAAIKRYREETGEGLAEAKVAVESFESGQSLSNTEPLDDSDLTDEVLRLLERGELIPAVKLYREQSGVCLKDAKEAVEEIGRRHGIESVSSSGCLGVVLLMVAALTTVIRLSIEAS